MSIFSSSLCILRLLKNRQIISGNFFEIFLTFHITDVKYFQK
jgi:hypothetical protein